MLRSTNRVHSPISIASANAERDRLPASPRVSVRTGDAFLFFNADEQPPLIFAVGFVIAGNESPVTQEVLE